MTKPKRKPQLTSEPHDMRIADRKYQPSKAEHETETDMPGLSLKWAREAFMRPFRFIPDPD